MAESKDTFFIKAEDLMAKAAKIEKGSFFGNLAKGKGERLEEACELYKQAATNYKLAKQWENAASAYLKCANCETVNKTGDAAEYIMEAANMMKKINTANGIKMMEQAIDLYCQSSRLLYAARARKTIAELYEQDGELTLAAKNFQEAADLFSAENDNTSNYNNMLLKVAELNTLKADTNFIESIGIYEKVADKYLENRLTAPSAKELFFKSTLLYLANDVFSLIIKDSIGAEKALEKYTDKDPSYQSTREYKFSVSLMKAIDERNIQNFSDACYDFNNIIPLDKWKTNILSKIKSTIKATMTEDIGVL